MNEIGHRPKIELKYAIPLILLAAIFTGLMATVVKIGTSHLTTASMIFWRNAIGLLLLWPYLQFTSQTIHPKQIKFHLIRGVTNFVLTYLFFYSLRFLSVTDSTLLLNTFPIFIPIVALIWRKVPIYHRLWWPIGIAFLGMVLILHPGVSIFEWHALYALAAGIIAAISLVSLRLGHYSEPQSRIIFYLFAINIVLSLPFTLFSFQQSWLSFTPIDFLWIGLLGLVAFGYQISITAATKFAPIRFLAPFLYTSLVVTLIFDKVIWHASLSLLGWIGLFLIIGGAFLMLLIYPKQDLAS